MPNRDGSGSLVQTPGKIDIQLATSRDGIHWHRAPGRKPFICLGPEGTFWSGMVFTRSRCFRMGDDLWFFFSGYNISHSGAELDFIKPERGAGRAVLRLDGFISADSAYTGGELITRPLIFSGRKLELNVATGAGGTVKVEIQDEAGKPIKGFTEADADEINGNYIRVPASWDRSTDVAGLAGKPIKIRFLMRDCKLYAFQFVE